MNVIHISLKKWKFFALGYLSLDEERITKIDYRIHQNEEYSKRSMFDSRKNKSEGFNRPSDQLISNILAKNDSTVMDFYFSIADRNEWSNDTLTGLHVVTLLLLVADNHAVLNLCEKYSIKVESFAIMSDKNKTRDEFCSEPDVMYPTKNGILHRRNRSDGEIDYVVYIPELDHH